MGLLQGGKKVAQGLGTTLNLAVEQKDHRLHDEVQQAVSLATPDLLITAEVKGSRVRAGGNVRFSKLLKKRSAWPRPLEECVLNSDDRVELRVRVGSAPGLADAMGRDTLITSVLFSHTPLCPESMPTPFF
jgi:hypothetical protein